MYGAILGDMIGAPYEFDQGSKVKDFPLFSKESQFTDDSVMTIAVAEALLGLDHNADDEAVHHAVITSMRAWGRKYPNSGYGYRFSRWLFSHEQPKPYNSWGNGSAMRVSSVGWLFDTIEETRRYAKLTTEVTHNHPEGIKGAEATASAIYLARKGASKDEIKEYIIQEFGYDLSRTCDEIRPTYHHVESCQETVPEAITAFLEGTDFEDVIRTAVSLGGDCDTLTCIAGSIAEAFYGVPAELKRECENRLPEDMKKILYQVNEHRQQIAVKGDWETKEMPDKNETFVLHRMISRDDYKVLRMGNIPEEMEDKWFWYMEGNRLYAYRSWTGFNIFILDIQPDGSEHPVTVNRDPEQYRSTSSEEDEATLNNLLDYWTKPQYDYYAEWIHEISQIINAKE